jgi:transcriptional regulator of aromatic amino acid metabolism
VRVICATQRNLVELVQKGMFREDLYYRLNVLTLNLPPLRERPQDIMPLTELFVARFADEQGVPRPKLSADLGNVLTRYGWPGNVRQLKNAFTVRLPNWKATSYAHRIFCCRTLMPLPCLSAKMRWKGRLMRSPAALSARY